jgi:hypothetical protein
VSYEIRCAARAELDLAVEWAAGEGWNPGRHDADAFHAADPGGFFLGLLDGAPIASISAVSYGPGFGFVGFYIVRPDQRGHGYGLRLWTEAMRHLPTQNIGLDGVLAQQKSYEKSGFKLAYGNVRYEGAGSAMRPADPHVVPLGQVPFERLRDYDDAIFPASRETFLRKWIAQPGSLALGYVRGGQLSGYGMIRGCRKGSKIGPLFADAADIAEALFHGLASHAAEGPIYLDVPEVNAEAVALAKAHRMTPMFQTVRMYTKDAPSVPLARVFGVTTFELG